MQRKASKKTRTANTAEKRFIAWIKEQPCACCPNFEAPVIADHIRGSTYKLKYQLVTVLVGPWFIIPLCAVCDRIKTNGSHSAFEKFFGQSQGWFWADVVEGYPGEIPPDVMGALITEIQAHYQYAL